MRGESEMMKPKEKMYSAVVRRHVELMGEISLKLRIMKLFFQDEGMERREVVVTYPLHLILVVLFTTLAYFVYKGVEGALAVLILCIFYSLASFVALIPFVGVILQAGAMHYFIEPFVFSLTRIYPTWLTSAIFWVYVAMGAFSTVVMTVIFLLRD
jgi:hypothetical protein